MGDNQDEEVVMSHKDWKESVKYSVDLVGQYGRIWRTLSSAVEDKFFYLALLLQANFICVPDIQHRLSHFCCEYNEGCIVALKRYEDGHSEVFLCTSVLLHVTRSADDFNEIRGAFKFFEENFIDCECETCFEANFMLEDAKTNYWVLQKPFGYKLLMRVDPKPIELGTTVLCTRC